MLQNLFDPKFDLVYSMFKYIESTRLFYFSPDTMEPPVQFELVGILLGLAIFNSVILDVQFPKIIFHRLMGKSIEAKERASRNGSTVVIVTLIVISWFLF